MPFMADKDIRGRAGEERAARHLQAQGYTVLDRNWRTAAGELDIVAARGPHLVVVEVKTRRTEWFGTRSKRSTSASATGCGASPARGPSRTPRSRGAAHCGSI